MKLPPSNEIFDQFKLDAPRVRIYIDGVYEPSYDIILAYLLNRNTSEYNNLRSMYWCTQTALAPVYIEKRMKLYKKKSNIHLLDDGTQHIMINDYCIHISKPFRVCKEKKNGGLHLAYHLMLTVRIYNSNYTVEWVRLKKPKKKKNRIKKTQEEDTEWCIIYIDND